jgi:hypothetical protein
MDRDEQILRLGVHLREEVRIVLTHIVRTHIVRTHIVRTHIVQFVHI